MIAARAVSPPVRAATMSASIPLTSSAGVVAPAGANLPDTHPAQQTGGRLAQQGPGDGQLGHTLLPPLVDGLMVSLCLPLAVTSKPYKPNGDALDRAHAQVYRNVGRWSRPVTHEPDPVTGLDQGARAWHARHG